MAAITLNLGRTFLFFISLPDPDPHVSSGEGLTITFHHQGIFCSPDAGNFNPPLPDGVHFEEDQTWPKEGVAVPTIDTGTTRYQFHKGVKAHHCKRPPDGETTSAFHVIHTP